MNPYMQSYLAPNGVDDIPVSLPESVVCMERGAYLCHERIHPCVVMLVPNSVGVILQSTGLATLLYDQ